MTPEQARAYALALNNAADIAETDGQEDIDLGAVLMSVEQKANDELRAAIERATKA
jgi:hypothetical protein